MFPDGGIARLRAYGVAVATLPESLSSLVDLSAATNGGVRIVQQKYSFKIFQRSVFLLKEILRRFYIVISVCKLNWD